MIDEECYACAELLSFVDPPYTIGEGERFISIPVERSVNPGTNIFVFSTVIEDDTALAGFDYGQFPDSGIGLVNVVLEDEMLVRAGIVIFDDSVVEYNENFTVSLQALSRDFTPLGNITQTTQVTIIDNDQVDISIHPAGPLTVNENSSVLYFSLNKTGVAVRSVLVVFDLSDPELINSGDGMYPDIQTFSFGPNDNIMELHIEVLDDDIVEDMEDHMIILRVPEGETGVNLLQESVIIRVLDDDVLNVSWEVNEVTVSEASGKVAVAVRKMGVNERSVFVRAFTVSGSAEANEDFSAVDVMIEFGPDDDVRVVEVNLTADGIVENQESFTIVLEVPPFETGVNIVENTATVLLDDSDFLTVGVDAMSVEVMEGSEVALTVMAVEGALDRTVLLSLALDPSGTGDVNISAAMVMLTGSNLNSTVIISGVDDNYFEGAESVALSITSSDSAVRFSPPDLTVTIAIEDNDSPQLTFSEEVYSFNESNSTEEIVVRFGAQTQTSHTWTLTSRALTATEGDDYSAIREILEFDSTGQERQRSFVIFDDLLSEGLETFMLELINAEGQIVNSSLVEIVDDEKLVVSFVGDSFTVSENEKLFFLEVNKSGVTISDILVTINFTDVTATGGSDYGVFPISEFLALSLILANETRVLYPVPITDDDIIENVESFNAYLQIKGETGAIVLGNITTARIYIEDNDKLTVFLDLLSIATVTESANTTGRTVQLEVSRDENATLDRDITVTLSTSDGSAVAPRDYMSISKDYTFTPDNPLLSFETSLLVVDDMTVEATEQFTISLSAPLNEASVELPENVTVITIIDDDEIIVNFERSSYTVTEGDGVVTVFLSKTGDNEIPVMVSVETMTVDDTATAGMDYNSTFQPLEFGADEAVIPLNIPILDDSILENTESFTVILTVASDVVNVVIGSERVTRITILDNDVVTVEFSEAEYSVSEGSGGVSVTVVLSGDTEREVAVDVFTTAGTASESDFSPLIETLTFFPGETSKSLVISITQDTMCEEEETFFVGLRSSDPNVVLGGVNTSAVVITDDDVCGVGFMNDTTRVDEPESPSNSEETFCVGRTTETMFERDITLAVVAVELVDIQVQNQALFGEDFILNPLILTLPSTEAQVCFTVTILSDDRLEEEEQFNISLIPEAGLQTSRAEINVTIVDRDVNITDGVPTVEFSAITYSVTEDAGLVNIVVEITYPDDFNDTETILSVLFTTIDGSAQAPMDYVAQIGTSVNFEFEDGQTTATVPVPVVIVMDGVMEQTEIFTVSLSLPRIPRVALGDNIEASIIIADAVAGDVFVNDTVVGDPLFVVPLSFTDDSHEFEETPSLCYEIHGQAGKTFNLVSDTCTSVNALYETSAANSELNYISTIGIRAVNLLRQCVDITVPVNCNPTIIRGDIGILPMPRYDEAGISVRRSGSSAVRVSVPNCASSPLVMWIRCRRPNNQPQLRFDITRGLNLDPTSHGLLGQFWNIPIRVTPFHFNGPIPDNPDALQSQELYLVEVRPADSSGTRRFVAEYYPISWDHNRPEPCLYAGDQQGGRIVEIKRYNDPVIQNNYRLYRTAGLFATQFRYTRFQHQCAVEGIPGR
jgi:hypothetical protein